MKRETFGAEYFLGKFKYAHPPVNVDNAEDKKLDGKKLLQYKYKTKNMDKTSKGNSTYNKQSGKQGVGGKFTLLLWKNFKLLSRKKLILVITFALPLFFLLLLALIRYAFHVEKHEDGVIYEPFEIKLNFPGDSLFVLYSPCNGDLDKIMKTAASGLVNESKGGHLVCVNDGKLLKDTLIANPSLFCGIQFDDQLRGNVSLPKNINMIFRYPAETRIVRKSSINNDWQTDVTFPLSSAAGPREHEYEDGASPSYHQEGFLALQKSISLSLIQHFKQSDNPGRTPFNPPEIRMARFPYTAWIADPLLPLLPQMLTLILFICYLPFFCSTILFIATEKDSQIKEAMKIMGLPNWLHWLCWFIAIFVIMFLLVLLCTIFFKIKFQNGQYALFTLTNSYVLIVYLTLFGCSLITLCFAISVFFTSASLAAIVGALMWFIMYLPFSLTSTYFNKLGIAEKILISLSCNSAFSIGLYIILNFESQGIGSNWSNIFLPPTEDDNLSLGIIMLMLILDAFIHLCIALYVDGVYPGKYGVPKPWYFPFTKSYWCNSTKHSDEADSGSQSNPPSNAQFEEEPVGLQKGVEIKHLRKVYGTKVAVRDFSLNMYQDQITILLGHNGAGKTTTMSMLTGIITPTSGNAIINGYDIVHNMDRVRDSLGLCPQYNIMFNELTVYENLYFFGKLKGLRGKEIKTEVDRYIQLLDLEEKRKTQARNLSGGMKRRLCIGIALCGKSKVVFLDEPTAGVDPAARRIIWNLMQKEKKGRTILLSTHFMDEADLLGDRIAIMAGGKLQSCGTSFFLKKKFGSGYHLIMEKDKNCNVNEVTATLRRFVPGIKMESSVGSELTYSLSDQNTKAFEPMLKELETRGGQLGVRNFGISISTMEEVFMKTGADQGQEEELNKLEKTENKPRQPEIALNMGDDRYEAGRKLFTNQIYAMSLKRFLSSMRSWVILFLMILISFILTLFSMLSIGDLKMQEDLPLMPISLEKYTDAIVSVNGPISNAYKKSYIDIVNADSKVEDFESNDMVKSSLSIAEEDISKYRRKYIMGATFSDEKIIGWFNNEPFHAPPLALGTILRAMLQTALTPDYDITITNYPVPYSVDTKIRQQDISIGTLLAMTLDTILGFVSALFLIFYVQERGSGAKHLQFVSGARVGTFWTISYLWDYFLFIVLFVVIIITIACFQEDGLSSVNELGRIFLVLLLYAFAMLPLILFASFLFNNAARGFTYFLIFTLVTGFLLVIIINAVRAIERIKISIDVIHHILLIFPNYCMCSAIVNMYKIQNIFKICNDAQIACISALDVSKEICEQRICEIYEDCCGVAEDYFAWKEPGILKNVVYFLLVGIVLLAIVFFIDYGTLTYISYGLIGTSKRKTKKGDEPTEDSDVIAERDKLNKMTENEIKQYSIGLRNVTKQYWSFLAVKELSLAVSKGECFGLLGANGAGKTTTFKMMSGQEILSRGDIWIFGMNVKKQLKDIYKVTGYCPQFDALLDNLTGRETLIIFCLLHGVKRNEAKIAAEKYAREYDFHRYLDKIVRQYSGGNRRKLSTALAMIGDPQVIYLDEPTTGMDPATKRHIWNNINKARDSGKTVVLTSHSMEECEALCTRIAIMVNGQFKCLGSTQHLKSKFSQGYTLTIKLKKTKGAVITDKEIAPVKNYVEKNFPGAVLKESFQELLSYYIKGTSLSWSKMFGLMEEAKDKFNIQDYSLGQCSLEQVFLHFTQNQVEDKRIK